MKDSTRKITYSIFVLVSLLVLTISLLQILPYLFHVTFLPLLNSSPFSIKISTAICFILISTALLFAFVQYHMARVFLSMIAFFISLTAILSSIFKVDVGHDFDICSHLMSSNTALCFLMISFVVMSIKYANKYKIISLVNFMLIIATTILAVGGLISYFANIQWIYSFEVINYMSPLAGMLFLIIIFPLIFLLLINKQRLNYRFSYIPYLVFFVSFLFFNIFWGFVLYKNYINFTSMQLQIEKLLTSKVNTLIRNNISMLRRLTEHWEQENKIIRYMWHSDAHGIIRDSDFFYGVVLLNANGQVSASEPENIIISQQVFEALKVKVYGKNSVMLYVAGNEDIDSPQFYILTPIQVHDKISGYLLAIIDINQFIASVINAEIKNHYDIYVYYKANVIYRSSNNSIQHEYDHSHVMSDAIYPFYVDIIPTNQFKHVYFTDLPILILTLGLVLSLVLGLLAYFLQAISMLNKKNQLILMTAGEGIFGLDERGLITFINPAAEQILMYTHNELIGKLPPFLNLQIINHKTVSEGEGIFYRKDNHEIPVYFMSRPILTKNNQVVGAVIVFNDLSKLREKEMALARRTAQLEAANHELEALSYSVSHDLLAPLRHIMSFIDLLQEDSENILSEDSQENFQIIMRSAKKMAELIDDLLQFSRSGRLELNREIVSTKALLDEIVEDFAHEIKNNNVTLICHHLPEIYADKHMMRQVFENLLGNAIKFTSKKENPLINISCYESDDNYLFSVSDNGVGFDEKYKDKLFGVFQRLHKESEYPGTGIGLANVARIIGRHGGKVFASGKIDHGATISFTIPKMKGENIDEV